MMVCCGKTACRHCVTTKMIKTRRMEREALQRKGNSNALDASANIIALLIQNSQLHYKSTTLSKIWLLRRRITFRYTARITLMWLLSATAVTIEHSYARTAHMKTILTTSTHVVHSTKMASLTFSWKIYKRLWLLSNELSHSQMI